MRRGVVLIVVLGAAAVLTLGLVVGLFVLRAGDESEAGPKRPAGAFGLEVRAVQRAVPEACRGKRSAPPVFCASDGIAYELGPPELDGTQVRSVRAELSQNADGWLVRIELDDNGAAAFARVTTELAEAGRGGAARQLALVVDAEVVSAPQVVEPITGGQIDITGRFSKADAEALVQRISG